MIEINQTATGQLMPIAKNYMVDYFSKGEARLNQWVNFKRSMSKGSMAPFTWNGYFTENNESLDTSSTDLVRKNLGYCSGIFYRHQG